MKLFRRVAGYGPWAVAAALGLDISYPVQAAPPETRHPVPISAAGPMASTDNPETSTNIQIAWLADPGLFQCTLSAKSTGKGVELSGYVASEPAHLKAVAIAKAVCPGPVVDQIKVHAGVPIQMARGAAPAELATNASSALAEAIGDKILGLQVVCPSAGRVEVTGTLPSLEDKLLVSKCMKLLPGCTHVINKTSAPGSAAGDAIVANVPLMITKMEKGSPNSAKPINETPVPMPVMVRQQPMPTPMPTKPTNMVSEMPMPAPRPVVTPVTKASADMKPDNKNTVVQPPMGKPGFSQVYDVKPPEAANIQNDSSKVPEPSWPMPTPVMPVMPVSMTEEKKPTEIKAIDSTKGPDLGLPDINTAKAMEPVRPTTVDRPQILHLLPEAKNDKIVKVPDVPEPPKPIVVPPIMPPTATSSAPSVMPPAPIAAPMVMPPAKETSIVQSPYGGLVKPITAPPPSPAPVELPKPADLPKAIDMPKPVLEMSAPGKATVTDVTPPAPAPVVAKRVEEVKAPEAPKPIVVEKAVEKPCDAVKATEPSKECKECGGDKQCECTKCPDMAKPAVPAVVEKTCEASKTPEVSKECKECKECGADKQCECTKCPDTPKTAVVDKPCEVCKAPELPKPIAVEKTTEGIKAPATPMPVVAEKLNDDIKMPELPKPVLVDKPAEDTKLVEAPKLISLPKPAEIDISKPAPKLERFTAPTKPVENANTKTTKEPISLVLDGETVRRAVEDVCRGAGTDLKVTCSPNRQLIIAVKVASQGEWDRLYAKVKSLPEINGYTVMYNAQVDTPTIKPVAASALATTPNEPAPAKPAATSAPLMGVLRSNGASNAPSAEAAKAAIEKLCQGKGDDLSIRTPGGKQVAVSMKVSCSADWEILYAQIKALPEIAGCSVIYNVSVK